MLLQLQPEYPETLEVRVEVVSLVREDIGDWKSPRLTECWSSSESSSGSSLMNPSADSYWGHPAAGGSSEAKSAMRRSM